MAEFVWVSYGRHELAVDLHTCRRYSLNRRLLRLGDLSPRPIYEVAYYLTPQGDWIRYVGELRNSVEIIGGEQKIGCEWKSHVYTVMLVDRETFDSEEMDYIASKYRNYKLRCLEEFGTLYSHYSPVEATRYILHRGYWLPPELEAYRKQIEAEIALEDKNGDWEQASERVLEAPPKWDARSRTLTVGDLIFRPIRRDAERQSEIFDALEASGWSRTPIESPFGELHRERFEQTLKDMNKKAREKGWPIRFSRDGDCFSWFLV